MKNALHFVGFTDPMRYAAAVRIFGEPDIIHRWWDWRAVKEVAEGDTVVFCDGEPAEPKIHSYDDSAHTGDADDADEEDEL